MHLLAYREYQVEEWLSFRGMAMAPFSFGVPVTGDTDTHGQLAEPARARVVARRTTRTVHRLFCEELLQVMCRIHADHSQHIDETTVGKIVSLSSTYSGTRPLEID